MIYMLHVTRKERPPSLGYNRHAHLSLTPKSTERKRGRERGRGWVERNTSNPTVTGHGQYYHQSRGKAIQQKCTVHVHVHVHLAAPELQVHIHVHVHVQMYMYILHLYTTCSTHCSSTHTSPLCLSYIHEHVTVCNTS